MVSFQLFSKHIVDQSLHYMLPHIFVPQRNDVYCGSDVATEHVRIYCPTQKLTCQEKRLLRR